MISGNYWIDLMLMWGFVVALLFAAALLEAVYFCVDLVYRSISNLRKTK